MLLDLISTTIRLLPNVSVFAEREGKLFFFASFFDSVSWLGVGMRSEVNDDRFHIKFVFNVFTFRNLFLCLIKKDMLLNCISTISSFLLNVSVIAEREWSCFFSFFQQCALTNLVIFYKVGI